MLCSRSGKVGGSLFLRQVCFHGFRGESPAHPLPAGNLLCTLWLADPESGRKWLCPLWLLKKAPLGNSLTCDSSVPSLSHRSKEDPQASASFGPHQPVANLSGILHRHPLGSNMRAGTSPPSISIFQAGA